MGAVRIWIAAALAIAGPTHAQSVVHWRPYVIEASNRFGVPMTWIEAVMQAESRGRTTLNGRPIRSSAGAIGLMQLMPSTWVEMRARLGLGSDPDDPHDNILAGTFYLRLMYHSLMRAARLNVGSSMTRAAFPDVRRLPFEDCRRVISTGSSMRGWLTKARCCHELAP